MERLAWKNNKGIDYLYLDFRDIKDVEVKEVTEELTGIIDELANESLNMVINSTGLKITFGVYTMIKSIAKKAQPKINRSCYVGVSTSSKTIYKVYQAFTGSKSLVIDTLEEGISYVTEKN